MKHECSQYNKDEEWYCVLDHEKKVLHVGVNSEYGIDVKYCPFCGFNIEQSKENK